MSPWQKRARIGLAIFGVAVAVVVYVSMGERRQAPPPAPVPRTDRNSQVEVYGGEAQRLREAERDFSIKFARSLSYDDGSQKLFEVAITVVKSDGRTYVVTADEATAGKDQREKQLTGHVRLKVSDGFEMTTDRATHNQDDSIVRAPGAVSFSKGGMTGSGGNATYDQGRDVLTINEQAKVKMADEKGQTTTDFAAGVAVLDRLANTLTLDGQAHVLRNQQVIDADHVVTRLSDDEQIVQFIELRNNARVTGGTAIDSMSARDIDMDYTDDGQALERVALNGGAGVAMKGNSGGAGRQIVGEALDVRLATDGSIVGLIGRDKVRLDLPASGDTPAGSISADTLDGAGEAGRGLTTTDFRGKVEYREAGKRGAKDRIVRAQSLTAMLADDAVSDAAFKGRVTFEEEGLSARAAEISYQPRKNTIALGGLDAGGAPHVSVDQISIDAKTIGVGLQDRVISAVDVKTTLAPKTGAPAASGSKAGGVSIPGLLKQDEVANINANSLEYRGQAGQAVYRGGATMWQGSTTIRADMITLNQEKGSLVATGSATSRLDLDTGLSTGSGHEIRYDDENRRVTYSAAPLAPTSEKESKGGRALPVRDAQLRGPQGDLSAERIEIVLAKQGNTVERLEGHTRVRLKLDERTAVGARLTYYASEEKYVMSGAAATPVKITDSQTSPSGAVSCSETTGRTLTFFKSTDRIIVDGNEQKRTETQFTSCAPPSTR
jgi:LPS export ABC transporter protein LptC/lipopolysaccharide transport protein LptA